MSSSHINVTLLNINYTEKTLPVFSISEFVRKLPLYPVQRFSPLRGSQNVNHYVLVGGGLVVTTFHGTNECFGLVMCMLSHVPHNVLRGWVGA